MRYRKKQTAGKAWLHFCIKGAGKLLGGIVLLLVGLLSLNRRRYQNALKKLANGAGYFCALFNISVERYRDADDKDRLLSEKEGLS